MQTSTSATKETTIMAKASPASNDGAPHWKGYGILILVKVKTDSLYKSGISDYADIYET